MEVYMIAFTRPLTTTYIGGGKRRVDRTFGFWTGLSEGEGLLIKVPGVDTVGDKKCFLTDFASVPRLFRWAIPKDGDYNQPAVLHDWLYHNVGLVEVIEVNGNVRMHQFSRKECDFIFNRAMKILNDSKAEIKISNWKRRTMYRAVRVGGWKGWNKRKKEIANESN